MKDRKSFLEDLYKIENDTRNINLDTRGFYNGLYEFYVDLYKKSYQKGFREGFKTGFDDANDNWRNE